MTFKKYTQQFSYNIQLAYPVILGMLGHTLVGIVDNIMVGKLGATELAAVSLGNSFIFLAMSLGIGFSTAITPLIAEADGTSDLQQSKAAFYNGIFLCTILGVFLFLGIYFIKPLLALMGQPEAVVTLAKPYLDMVAVSLIPLVIFQAYSTERYGATIKCTIKELCVLKTVVNDSWQYLSPKSSYNIAEEESENDN